MRLNVLLLIACLVGGCSTESETIRIKGSDTEVNLVVQLTESFHDTSKETFISVSGGGSGLGIASLMNGTADIANSSRTINSVELRLLKEKQVEIDSFIFAIDAIAFVISEDLGIDSINIEHLANILSGKVDNWSSLVKRSIPITIYGRQSNSGTHDFVKNKLKIDFSPHARQMNGNAQILAAIQSDHSGIGYVGAGYMLHGGGKGLKVLKIVNEKGIASSPLDEVTIENHEYFFQRPLFQFYKRTSYDKIKEFLDFERSEKGIDIIRKSGYYKVSI